MDFKGKTVIVTGAGKGIGREIVRMLAERGAQVVALTRSAADVEELRVEPSCRAIQVDLEDADATREAVIAAL
ncbi:SDR family NAD(P)-dependent oxidoreductase, partial [Rhizobium ruizarguesonis]